jgi:hypothetical protein
MRDILQQLMREIFNITSCERCLTTAHVRDIQKQLKSEIPYNSSCERYSTTTHVRDILKHPTTAHIDIQQQLM